MRQGHPLMPHSFLRLAVVQLVTGLPADQIFFFGLTLFLMSCWHAPLGLAHSAELHSDLLVRDVLHYMACGLALHPFLRNLAVPHAPAVVGAR